MGRNRVLSFMSQLSAGSRNPTPSSSPPNGSPPLANNKPAPVHDPFPNNQHHSGRPITPPSYPDRYGTTPLNDSTPGNTTSTSAAPAASPQRQGQSRQRSNSRPLSMVNAYQPPVMDVENTIPELQPIFSFLNSHSNKLYQEGYFLKLDDQNTHGRPNPDRTWTECFAQLVGTVLSLWDAAELDAAGEDGEVLPSFINLTDASIKMIESLPTRSNDEQPLQNILSISTAGRNRYLLHFNSHHSLVQWAAGIRLAMFEQDTLQEAYTGALIAGKGKTLNNINVVMERSRMKMESWVRVRFGAGVPWRRCWCVITPPDEKEYAKLQKELKKRSPYDRSAVPVLKGDIKFYDSRKDGKKQKKAQPIAAITDAYAAYAIYPQSKALIDASTLLKVEGSVTIYSDPPSSTEGFVFIMPETHPAVSGFEMLLRFLFPTWDTFGLYGRPGRLVASVLDPRSLMFAMPKHKRYGYLEILDVNSLIVESGSTDWNEREWRRRLKEVTGTRMNAVEDGSRSHSRSDSRRSARLSFGGAAGGTTRAKVGFADDRGSVRSSRSFSLSGPERTDSAPPDGSKHGLQPMTGAQGHVRNASDSNVMGAPQPQRVDYGYDAGHYGNFPQQNQGPPRSPMRERLAQNNPPSSEDERNGPLSPPVGELGNMGRMQTPEPVSQPPAFKRTRQEPPSGKAYHSPELRRANSRLSSSTLAQLAKAGGVAIPGSAGQDQAPYGRNAEDNVVTGPSVDPHANPVGMTANDNRSREALSPPGPNAYSNRLPPPLDTSRQRSRSPIGQPRTPTSPYTRGPNPQYPPQPSEGGRPAYPPGQPGPPGPMSRSPNPQSPINTRGIPPGPSGAGRGMPPDYRGPPGGGNYRPGPGPGPAPGPGPRQQGPGGPPVSPPRKPVPQRPGGGVTPHDIIDSYAAPPAAPPHGGQQRPGTPSDRRPPPPHGYGGDPNSTTLPERPRAGVLKTVGGGQESAPAPPRDFDIPNFGPTINYGASPSKRTQSPAPRGPPVPQHGQRPYSPAGPGPNVGGRRSPMPPPGNGRQDSGDPAQRTRQWQPGGSAPGGGGQGVTPEQYVQQRAAAAAPQFSHARSPSGNTLGGATETPPAMKRRSSYDMFKQGGHSRGNSADLLRPSSQGNAANAGEFSSHMSARQQEQVARMTGGPLVNMGGNQRQQAPPSSGLVSTIESREREKQHMRQGINQQAGGQYAVNPRSVSPMPPGQGAGQFGPGGPQPPPFGGMDGRASPAYGSPGSFSRPMPPSSPSPQQMDPRFMPPQGQYTSTQGPGQPRRNVHPQYQGQAF